MELMGKQNFGSWKNTLKELLWDLIHLVMISTMTTADILPFMGCPMDGSREKPCLIPNSTILTVVITFMQQGLLLTGLEQQQMQHKKQPI